MTIANLAIWAIAALATAGVILQPLKLPGAVWALAGAVALVGLGLLPLRSALQGIGRGIDVYLFLGGMMLLAEAAREAALFEWLAAQAVAAARGSAARLFGLIYLVGIAVTVFLSNDATAVVLTPAVAAVCRTARIDRPLPYLLICAFIANAASFVLPISNPANLVIYAGRMPPLLQWLPHFALPSLLSIAATYAVLRLTQRAALRPGIATPSGTPPLTTAGKSAALGIAATALLLMLASALGRDLGLPTCLAGLVTLASVAFTMRSSPWRCVREISWGIVPLVAGLFVMVEALERSGAIRALSAGLRSQAQHSAPLAAAATGVALGFTSNLINNLPAGLVAGTAVQAAQVPAVFSSAALIGVDIGPNLSVTGSLATLLWLTALRRDGIRAGAWDFLKVGVRVMPPALLLALGALLLYPPQ